MSWTNRKFNLAPTAVLVIACAVVMLLSCKSEAKVKSRVKHMSELAKDGRTMYVDPISNRAFMKESNENSSTQFVAYRVGFTESVPPAKDKQLEVQKYYQYQMEYDWKAIVDGDSVRPAFFHSVPPLNNLVSEAIIVFELPDQKIPSSLVYNDSWGNWGKQVIPVTRKLNQTY